MANQDEKHEPELELLPQKKREPTRFDLLKQFAELEVKVDQVLEKIRERRTKKRRVS